MSVRKTIWIRICDVVELRADHEVEALERLSAS